MCLLKQECNDGFFVCVFSVFFFPTVNFFCLYVLSIVLSITVEEDFCPENNHAGKS